MLAISVERKRRSRWMRTDENRNLDEGSTVAGRNPQECRALKSELSLAQRCLAIA